MSVAGRARTEEASQPPRPPRKAHALNHQQYGKALLAMSGIINLGTVFQDKSVLPSTQGKQPMIPCSIVADIHPFPIIHVRAMSSLGKLIPLRLCMAPILCRGLFLLLLQELTAPGGRSHDRAARRERPALKAGNQLPNAKCFATARSQKKRAQNAHEHVHRRAAEFFEHEHVQACTCKASPAEAHSIPLFLFNAFEGRGAWAPGHDKSKEGSP